VADRRVDDCVPTPGRSGTIRTDASTGSFDQDGSRTALGTFATKTEADRALTLAAADIARGTYVSPRCGGITLAEYAWSWLEQRTNLRPRSWELYERYLRLHERVLSRMGASRVIPAGTRCATTDRLKEVSVIA
jgi:hypothetical protein